LYNPFKFGILYDLISEKEGLNEMKQIGVGILGFGTVGAGVADGLIRNRKTMAERLGVEVVLRRIADLDITTDRGIAVNKLLLTTDAMSLIEDKTIDVIVELIGGTGIAKTLVLAALNAGKSVVTANKKLNRAMKYSELRRRVAWTSISVPAWGAVSRSSACCVKDWRAMRSRASTAS
jgi:homoserine dehydrogenase